MDKVILIAGATGHLGGKIVDCLLADGATVKALVRPETAVQKIDKLKEKKVQVIQVDMNNQAELVQHFRGAHCFVSALSGLEETIIHVQRQLLEACVLAHVPRFIPSDYCIDFNDLQPGQNRNLDLRRKFHYFLDQANIQATSIFNGAFMDLLTTEMPLILTKPKRILCWGNPKQPMEFTKTDNVAAFTAKVALDEQTPRYLHIAGDILSCNDFVALLTALTGKRYKIFRPGGIGLLSFMIKATKFFSASSKDLYPAWQGMQYMRDMMEGRVKIGEHNNELYPNINWIKVKEFLMAENMEAK